MNIGIMKKILFFVMAAALFGGCKKEDDVVETPCPVAGVEMPASSADNPIRPGAEITLQGNGFTQSSEIWLRGSAETKAGGQDVKANVTAVTASFITFEAPEVYGSQSVVLKQDGGEWNLGVLTFAAQSEEPEPPVEGDILPDKVSVVKVKYNDGKGDYVTEYAFDYDEQDRVVKLVKKEFETDILTTVYTYSDNRITAEANGGEYIQYQKWSYTLADGRVTKYEVETVGGKMGGTIKDAIVLTYDENGYITAAAGTEVSETDRNPSTAEIEEKLVFTDGTLTKYTTTEVVNYDDSKDRYSLDVDFVPGPLNNLNIDIMAIDWIGEYLYATPAYLLNMGGERSLQLPESIHVSYIDGNTGSKDDEFTNEFDYEMNGEYISVIKISRDGQLETVIEIDYEK